MANQSFDIKDMRLADSGEKKIQWAFRNMPALRSIEERFSREKPFLGYRISVSVHVEAKTACLARVLEVGGAEVALTGCNPLSTQDDVAAALVRGGMSVFCIHGADEQLYNKHLEQALSIHPHVVIDDGGDFAALLHSKRKDLQDALLGGCEETTTGVHRLRILEQDSKLAYPVIAVNDARSKHLFDNRFGTGQSVWTAIMDTTNLLVSGKTVVVAGFGMCGKGVALRAKGLGARVIVTEIDPVKASEAIMEGYDVMPMIEAASWGDVFVTVTGCNDVLTKIHFDKMKDGAICCNAGHFDIEVKVTDLEASCSSSYEARPNIVGYKLNNGRTIFVIAAGRLVNLASGDGHPAEIMDMSFSLQALCAEYMILNAKKLEKKVYDTPDEIDHAVAKLYLSSRQCSIDSLTPEQQTYMNSWTL